MSSSSRLQVRGAAWLAQVSDDDIVEHVGRFAFERGLGYADAERVESINTGDNGRMVLATVNGGAVHAYTTMLTVPRVGAPPQDWTSRCSCPVQKACKHVAAVVLTGREVLGGSQPAVGDEAWREFADRFLGDDDTAQAFTDADALGLRIAATVAPRSGTDSSPRTRFELIPCRRGKTGRWNMSIEWTDVRTDARSSGRRFFVPEQSQALTRILERWRGAGNVMSRAPRLMLDELGGGVWDDLQMAAAAGVELLPAFAHPDAEVELLDHPVRTDIRFADSGDGSLVGRTDIDLHRPGRLVLIGDPAHGLVIMDEHNLVLAGLDRPMSSMAQWLASKGPVTVPESVADSFREAQLPKLAKRYGVVSGGSVERPRLALVEPLRLHLDVRRESETAIRVVTSVRYPGGERHTMALDASPRTGRDRHAERGLVEQLEPLLRKASLLEAIGGIGWWPKESEIFTDFAAVRFTQLLDELDDHDLVIVSRADDLPVFEEAQDDPLIEIGADESSEIDWFDLRVEVSVGGEKVPFEPLFRALARGEELLLLDSGTWFSLDHPELQRLSSLISEARELSDQRSGSGLQLNKFHLGYWDELVELGVVSQASAEWTRRVEQLKSVGEGTPPSPPTGFKATLRPYQVDGYHWLSSIWDSGLGGILADDMGLGKTVQALAMIARAHEAGELTEPVLVVAPSSMVGTWVREAATFAPDLPVVAVRNTAGKRGEPLAETVAGAALVVTSYTVLRLDADEFESLPWRGLLLDEAQFIKNHQSKTFQSAKRLRTPFTLAITGTPLENSLMDLWAMLALAAPGLFPKPELFASTYRKPIESGAEPEKLDQLRRRIRPLMMRRTKEVVAADLPPKQIQLQEISLTSKHDAYYRRHLQRERQRILGLLDDPDANRIAILASLTRLRQLSLDPRLVDDEYTSREPSAKIAFLIDQLRELSAEGHRALVFSQFTSYLRLVEAALHDAGITTNYLDGSTTSRQDVIDDFKDGDAAAFLISLKAGGVGLTLTEADYVFVLDPWWNPAAEAQAIDRAHRIGQERPVMVYRLFSQGTIEEKVVDLQERKRDLFNRVVDGGGGASGAITADDIRAMLA
ncbi:DEAD/DEAH box helicase [Yimella sp. cx-51]|uniref:DEAD/DEAH box helicase n=1 Tax=Yimella sp. cx-51 TaxID=2770551 RepID=UPI00165EBD86|nr:DEAD/DEAH box helicase [Yimella sp. cx-51]MBC9955565.1 DEAD/DEAH box helicase [Yimella sp. cx-51]QTH37858.1 DEAD/DEAH box helicase [Yimella sp. cx-51]